MNAGDFRRFFTWMEQIPAEVLAADAHLSFVYGAMLYNTGQIGRVEEYLSTAQQAYEHPAPTQHSPEDASLPGQIVTFRPQTRRRFWAYCCAFAIWGFA